jgi:replicative DNA helicase
MRAVYAAAALGPLRKRGGLRPLGFGRPRCGAAVSTGERIVEADRQDSSVSKDLERANTEDAGELPPTLRDVIVGGLEQIEKNYLEHREVTGVPTGFPDLDRLTSGLQPGNLILVSARPAVGKTSLVLDFARHAAIRAGVPTLFCPLELTKTEVSQRLTCAECTVDSQRFRTGRMDEADWSRLTRSLGKLADGSMWIDDAAVSSVSTIHEKAKRLHSRHGLGLLVVDGVQALLPFRPVENLYEHVSYSVRGLKMIARELNIPVVVTSPVTRQPEGRSDRRPMLSDLRDSGALEDTADLIIFIYRDELYDWESPRKGEADLIIGKHRQGPTDTVTVTFQGQYARFAPIAARNI